MWTAVRDPAATDQPLQWKTVHLLHAVRLRRPTRNTYWYVVSLSLFHLCLFASFSRCHATHGPLATPWHRPPALFLSFSSFFSSSLVLPFFLSFFIFWFSTTLQLYSQSTIWFCFILLLIWLFHSNFFFFFFYLFR